MENVMEGGQLGKTSAVRVHTYTLTQTHAQLNQLSQQLSDNVI